MSFARFPRFSAVAGLSALACLPPAISADAQQPALAQVNAQGACPDNPAALRQGASTGTLSKEEWDAIMRSEAQVLRPMADLFRTHELFEKVSRSVEFGQKVITYQVSGSEPPALFVQVAGTQVCGWLRKDDVYAIRQPMRLVDVPGYDNLKDVRGNPSRLVAKVVAMAIRKDGKLFKLPVYAAPFDPATGNGEAQALKGREIGYFAILNVYALRSGKSAGACVDVRDEDCFVLVGGLSDSKDGQAAGVAQIHGWVRARDVTLWPSALSAYYREGVSDVAIYSTDDAAKRAARGQKLGGQDVLAEKKDRHGEPKGQNIPRFPVVDTAKAAGKSIHTIVLAGDVCAQGDASCLSRALSEGGERKLQEQGEVGQGILRSKGVDVLLVIDGTESMGKYYGPIIQAVEDVSRDAQVKGLNVRFAAATFGDYKADKGDAPGPDKVIMRWPARFSSRPDALRNLSRALVGEDPHKDKPEAPFAALINATNSVPWNPDAAFRIVVWVGDHGNRAPGKHKTRGGHSLTEVLSEEDVVAALRNERNKATFAAIQVRGAYSAEDNAGMVRNASQIVSILRSQDRRLAPFEVLTADTSASATDDEIRAAVAKQLSAVISPAEVAETIVIERAQGKTTSSVSLSLPGAQLAEWYIEKELKLTPEKLREIAGQVQAIVPGYIVQDDRKPAYGYWLALRQNEFQILYDAMSRFCDTLGSNELTQDAVLDTMTAVLRAATFEEPDVETPINEFLEKKWSVPRENFSEILQFSIRQFAERLVSATTEAQAKYRGTICRKSKVFDFVAKKKRVRLEDIVMEGGRATVKKGVAPEEFLWDWAINTGIRYYFIPIEFLP